MKKGILLFIIMLLIGGFIAYVIHGALWGYIISLIYRVYAGYDAYQMSI